MEKELDVGEVRYDFNTQTLKFRCINCQREMEELYEKLTKKFKWSGKYMFITGTWHFRIPLTNIEFSITKWESLKEKMTWPKLPNV